MNGTDLTDTVHSKWEEQAKTAEAASEGSDVKIGSRIRRLCRPMKFNSIRISLYKDDDRVKFDVRFEQKLSVARLRAYLFLPQLDIELTQGDVV